MLRRLSLIVLGTSFVTMSSCCFTEQGNHAVRKMWCDYNTLRCPAFYLEQEDHLPYPAPQVGYYRWMYDKDPGHQLACLGPIPPRTCAPCDRVPAGNDPFEYEVYFPTAIPRQSDQLWGNKLPEPINIPGGPNPSAQSNGAGGGLANAAPRMVSFQFCLPCPLPSRHQRRRADHRLPVEAMRPKVRIRCKRRRVFRPSIFRPLNPSRSTIRRRLFKDPRRSKGQACD